MTGQLTPASALDFALHLTQATRQLSLDGFALVGETRIKADGTVVTETDEAVERLIRAEIKASFPHHNILGEEEGPSANAEGEANFGGDSSARWIIDPIDATANFVRGISIWATLIAFEQDGAITAGVVSAPALHQTWSAARGLGATRNGEPIHAAPSPPEVHKAFVAHGSLELMTQAWLNVTLTAGRSRGFGDFWGHCLVAQGSVDAMIDPVVSAWDVAALKIIVSEAGAIMTSLTNGDPLADGSAISASPQLHELLIRSTREAKDGKL